jgi:hypothetical protein
MNLDEETLKKFRLFHDRAAKIKVHEFLHRGTGLQIKAEKDKAVEITTNFPDDNLLRSYSTLIRPFYNPNDPISFLHICNFVSNPENNINEEFRQKAHNARKSWKKLLQTKTSDPSSSGTVLMFRDKEIKSSELIDLYFNGDIFHTELDKSDRLRLIQVPLFGEHTQMNFIDVLQKMGLLVLWLDEKIIKNLLSEK